MDDLFFAYAAVAVQQFAHAVFFFSFLDQPTMFEKRKLRGG
jgi:hypothetical protein